MKKIHKMTDKSIHWGVAHTAGKGKATSTGHLVR